MRLLIVTRFMLLVGAAAVLASCGGGSSSTTNTTNTPASITVSPTSLSLTHGAVAQIGSVQVLNSSNTAVSPTPTITYTSADPTSVSVTSSGLVCAGVFDANNVVCQIRNSSGNPLPDATVNITVAGGGLSTTVAVYVHAHVDTISVFGPPNPAVCSSQNQTEQFTAKAFSGATDITSKVGPFTWSTGNSSVATADTNGVVTSRQPGTTNVVASVANTTGTPALIVACPPKTISLTLSDGTSTSFNVATGTAETLAATVTDILGQPITGASLTYSSYVPSAASVSTTSVSTPGAGQTAIVASCTPPGCNPAAGPNVNFNGTGVGLAVYSNPVIGTITGSTATTVYVTGPDNPDGSANTSLIPITISTSAAGTAVTLQGSPNSMVFNRAGTTAFLGSTAGMLIFSASSNTVTATASGLTGKVLAVSNDGNKVVLSDTSNTPNKVFVYDNGVNASQEFDIAGVTAADFAADNSKAYFTSGSTIYVYSPNTSSLKTLSFAGDGVVFTPQVSLAYFGGSSILGLAVCNDARADSATGVANILGATPDGTHMIGAGANGWVDLSYTVTNSTGCPPTASNTLVIAPFNAAFVSTPTQIAVTSNDSYAFLTGCSGGCTGATGVPFYHFADQTTGTIPLSASGTLFSGSVTQDATSLYVGVTGGVHRIDLTKTPPADANQISVSFNPKIVVVRPQ
jgi:hypothetical protein